MVESIFNYSGPSRMDHPTPEEDTDDENPSDEDVPARAVPQKGPLRHRCLFNHCSSQLHTSLSMTHHRQHHVDHSREQRQHFCGHLSLGQQNTVAYTPNLRHHTDIESQVVPTRRHPNFEQQSAYLFKHSSVEQQKSTYRPSHLEWGSTPFYDPNLRQNTDTLTPSCSEHHISQGISHHHPHGETEFVLETILAAITSVASRADGQEGVNETVSQIREDLRRLLKAPDCSPPLLRRGFRSSNSTDVSGTFSTSPEISETSSTSSGPSVTSSTSSGASVTSSTTSGPSVTSSTSSGALVTSSTSSGITVTSCTSFRASETSCTSSGASEMATLREPSSDKVSPITSTTTTITTANHGPSNINNTTSIPTALSASYDSSSTTTITTTISSNSTTTTTSPAYTCVAAGVLSHPSPPSSRYSHVIPSFTPLPAPARLRQVPALPFANLTLSPATPHIVSSLSINHLSSSSTSSSLSQCSSSPSLASTCLSFTRTPSSSSSSSALSSTRSLILTQASPCVCSSGPVLRLPSIPRSSPSPSPPASPRPAPNPPPIPRPAYHLSSPSAPRPAHNPNSSIPASTQPPTGPPCMLGTTAPLLTSPYSPPLPNFPIETDIPTPASSLSLPSLPCSPYPACVNCPAHTCCTAYSTSNHYRTWPITRHASYSPRYTPYIRNKDRIDCFSKNTYITSPKFLSRVHSMALVMASQVTPVQDLLLSLSDTCLLTTGSALPQHILQEWRNSSAPQLREAITPSLRQYCRNFMVTMVCPRRVASQVVARVASMEDTAYHDHPHCKMKYCWQLSAALCLILEGLGRIHKAR